MSPRRDWSTGPILPSPLAASVTVEPPEFSEVVQHVVEESGRDPRLVDPDAGWGTVLEVLLEIMQEQLRLYGKAKDYAGVLEILGRADFEESMLWNFVITLDPIGVDLHDRIVLELVSVQTLEALAARVRRGEWDGDEPPPAPAQPAPDPVPVASPDEREPYRVRIEKEPHLRRVQIEVEAGLAAALAYDGWQAIDPTLLRLDLPGAGTVFFGRWNDGYALMAPVAPGTPSRDRYAARQLGDQTVLCDTIPADPPPPISRIRELCDQLARFASG